MSLNRVGTAAANVALRSVRFGMFGPVVEDEHDRHVGVVSSVSIAVEDGVVYGINTNTMSTKDAAVLGRLGDVDVDGLPRVDETRDVPDPADD